MINYSVISNNLETLEKQRRERERRKKKKIVKELFSTQGCYHKLLEILRAKRAVQWPEQEPAALEPAASSNSLEPAETLLFIYFHIFIVFSIKLSIFNSIY